MSDDRAARDRKYNSREIRDEFEGRPDLIRMRARTIVAQRVAITLVGLFMISTMILLAYNALASIRTRSTLLDCSEPTGECYKESQRRTGEAIQSLMDASEIRSATTREIIILATFCGDQGDSPSVVEIEECVYERLGEEGGE